MTRLLYLFCIGLLIACNSKNTQIVKITDSSKVRNVTTASTITDTSNIDSSIGNETLTCFVVIADTGTNYSSLRYKMFQLHDTLKQDIDTMGRTYNVVKKLIALPENDPDEIYAGDYYPRRYPSSFMSLEYINFYQDKYPDNMIALVCGIYDNRTSADSAVNSMKKLLPEAFVVKSDIYMGCLH